MAIEIVCFPISKPYVNVYQAGECLPKVSQPKPAHSGGKNLRSWRLKVLPLTTGAAERERRNEPGAQIPRGDSVFVN